MEEKIIHLLVIEGECGPRCQILATKGKRTYGRGDILVIKDEWGIGGIDAKLLATRDNRVRQSPQCLASFVIKLIHLKILLAEILPKTSETFSLLLLYVSNTST